MEAVARETGLYPASLAAFRPERIPGEPAWVAKIRREAFSRFTELGFPTARDEAWRSTSVAPIARTTFQLANGDANLEDAPHPGPLPGGEGGGARIVFVNGRYRAELSRGTPGVVQAGSLRDAIARSPERLEPHLARLASTRENAFAALNTAFLEDGAFVRIPRGTVVAEPIELVFLSTAPGDPSVSHPRILIVAETGSQATIVESYAGEGTSLTNAVTEIACGDGAVLEHYKMQRESLSAYHVHTIQVALGRSSNFTSHNVCLGAALARTDINAVFTGEGGECALNGLFLATGTQHVDNHTSIDHASPRCMSRELYKGILDGKSRGVFHGKIIVRQDAQKTDALQTNKNLLLSKEALVNSTPALEILADDVKCRHGSTIGQLDPGALFYLRSRGIGEKEARGLLTYGFAADVAGRIRVPWIRADVEALLGLRLSGSPGAA